MDNEKTIDCESSVKIANDVVAQIAAIAALEGEGVFAMGNNITSELLGKAGIKNILKNVRVEFINGKVMVAVAVTVDYGVSLPGISSAVQQKVKQAVESMTGLSVKGVTVKIAGISLTKNS